jgi:uncharacterized membrane protein HdeD (DUF308 family)
MQSIGNLIDEPLGNWWLLLVRGVLSFVAPGAMALVYLIAAWAIVTGIAEIVAAVELRKAIENEWALGLAGVLSVVFGILVAVQPGAGALALIWVIAAYALLFGILLIVLAFRVHGLQSSFRQRRAAT